jgi:membrane-bound serine protease (ClpP class)
MPVQIGWIILALLLYVLCAILLVLEIFIPSLGLLTIFSLAALAGGIFLFFQISLAAGWIGIAVAVVVIPTIWVLTYKLFPRTRIGRAMILQKVRREIGDAIPDRDELQRFLGRRGTTVGPLRPVGICEFDGRRVACLSESGFIARQRPVEVVRVEGHKITVRTIEPENKKT